MILAKTNNIQQDLIIEWLMNNPDNFLQEAINRCHDTDFKKCFDFIKEKAKAQAKDNCAMIEDKVVYGWAKEYFIDYEARSLKQKELEEENKKKVIKGRADDTLTSVRNQKAELEKNYPELLEKHKLNLIAWENELQAGLVNTDERVDEINRGLAVIIDDIDALRPKVEEKPKEEEKKPKKAIKKPVKEEIKQMSLFDF